MIKITSATLMIGMLAMLGFSAGTIAAKVTTVEADQAGQRQSMLERFEADGKGRFGDRERAGARRARSGEERGPGRRGPAAGRGIGRFDLDGNGTLDEAERATMDEARAERRAKMEARRAEMLERFDVDGDGKLAGAERSAARAAVRAERLERFDADGDGVLSRAERRAAMKEHPGRRGHHRHARPGADRPRRDADRPERPERSRGGDRPGRRRVI